MSAPRPQAVRRLLLASLVAQILAAGAHAAPATAGEAAEASGASAGPTLDTVIVTGSRLSGRTVKSSEAPIDIISAEEVQKASKTDLLEALQVLVPSLTLPSQPSNGLASRVVRGAYLRGLSPGHTLVLVNGKRRHATASVGAGGSEAAQPADLGLIPTSTIERIEVLRDGASAIYGSDAIAGVINIITRKDAEGGQASLRAGEFFDGEGGNLSARLGRGFALGEAGHLYATVQYDRRERTYRGAPAPDDMLYYFPLDADGNPVLPLGSLSSPRLPPGATPDPREATRDPRLQQINGQTPYTTIAATLDAGLPLNERVDAYALLTTAYRDAESFNGFRLPLRNENVRAIYPDGYSPINDQRERDYELLAGLRGLGEAWSWELSSSFGRNFAEIGSHDTVNPSFGLDSQTRFHIGNLDYKAWTTNYDLRRNFDGWGARPAELSLGLEYRLENHQITQGDYQSWAHGGQPILDGPNAGKPLGHAAGSGAQATYGYRPEEEVDSTRNSRAAYAGLSLYPADAWLLSLAARHERYSDFGSTWIGRISTRYDFSPALALRATVSNGFQAPTLGAQAYKKLNNWNTWVGHTLAVGSAQAQALGARPLEPEKSTNLSLGLVATLGPVNLAVDAYQIDVDGRIALSTSIREAIFPGSGALVAAVGLPADAGANYFINAADTRSRGVELVADAQHDLGRFGTFRWSLATHYNDTQITGIADTPQVLAAFDVPVFTVGQQQNLRFLTPRNKEVLTLGWRLDRWDLSLRQTHYGRIRRFGTPSTVPTSGPWAGQTEIEYDNGGLWITDLDLAVRLGERARLVANVTNLFDVKPGKLPEPLVGPAAKWAYSESGPITSDGGAWSVGVEFSW